MEEVAHNKSMCKGPIPTVLEERNIFNTFKRHEKKIAVLLKKARLLLNKKGLASCPELNKTPLCPTTNNIQDSEGSGNIDITSDDSTHFLKKRNVCNSFTKSNFEATELTDKQCILKSPVFDKLGTENVCQINKSLSKIKEGIINTFKTQEKKIEQLETEIVVLLNKASLESCARVSTYSQNFVGAILYKSVELIVGTNMTCLTSINISTKDLKHVNQALVEQAFQVYSGDGVHWWNNEFVKLSDLERQSPLVDLTILPRMTRSIPESSWVEETSLMSRSMGYRSVPRPLPPEPSEFTDSCGSETGNCQRRLGTDLLRMFLEEIRPDVSIHVMGRTIRAHRCILVSRCQYFAGSLSGHHSDSIHLRGFTFEAVHFAMCHIYSGAAHVPDSISLEELAGLADLLGLEGLKEVVAHALKTRHCHNFHKPCAGCLTGVPEVLPLAAAHGLDELYLRCLQWLMLHFERAWPCRAFASLRRELREKCLQQHLIHMTEETVLSTLMACDRLLASLPQLRWADPIIQLGLQLADACQLFLRQHLIDVLSSTTFAILDADSLHRLEEPLLAAAEALGPEQACYSYGHCHKILEHAWKSNHHLDILRKLDRHLEQCLAARADKAFRCHAWQKLEPSLRNRVREASRPSRLPRASSSDSSRTSSPATNRIPTGSPSLRRSLLLAARAPQIPVSPSTTRRTMNNITRPTQSSAAKSAPVHNIRSSTIKSPTAAPKVAVKNKFVSKKLPQKQEAPVKPANSKPSRISTPIVARRAAAVREECKSPSVCKSPSRTNVCKSPTKNTIAKSSCKSPSKAPTCKSPNKPIVTKSPVKNGSCKSSVKSDHKLSFVTSGQKSISKSSACKSPPVPMTSKSLTGTGLGGMTRSDTFLKDEPTVLTRTH